MQKKHLMKITNFFNTTFLYFTFILAALGLCCLCVGFLCLQWVEGTRPCSAWVSHCSGFFCGGALGYTGSAVVACGPQRMWASGGMQVQQLWHMDFVAQQHVLSSQTRDQTHAPCFGRQTPIQCATREVQKSQIFYDKDT